MSKPAPVQFSGHETFPFRYGWLKKGVDQLATVPDIFDLDDATTRLGVGKNMVKAIRHWLLATGLAEAANGRGLVVTELGRSLVADGGLDPYLEDSGTLWMLHYFLTRAPGRSHSWHWLFNLWKDREFQKEQLLVELSAFAHEAAGRASANTIRRDLDCLMGCYAPKLRAKDKAIQEDSLDCPLVELGLIQNAGDPQTYAFQVGDHVTLSSRVFAFCLHDFWMRHYAHQKTLAFEHIFYSVGSPGKVFKLSYAGLVRHLEALNVVTNGALRFDEQTGLRQVYRDQDCSTESLLRGVYAQGVA